MERSATPVRALTTDTNFTATGGNGTAFNVATSGYTNGVYAQGSTYGVYGNSYSGTAVFGTSGYSGTGVHGNSYSSYGVFGSSSTGYGVYGTSYSSDGVYGTSSGSGRTGVVGSCDQPYGIGVSGSSSSYYGVLGSTDTGIGVVGDVKAGGAGTSNIGVLGRVGAITPNSQSNTVGVYGQNLGTGAGGVGVYGSSTAGYGVLGILTGAGGQAALYGATYDGATPAFYAVNYGSKTTAFGPPIAGYFIGQVIINGNYTATGTKSAAVPHPDGSHRLLYCVESPEAWFEDFGEGIITGGKGEVKLDPDFVAVVDTAKLHVFTESHDEAHHLAVKTRSGNGFTVAADPSGPATARGVKASDISGTFTWRVVAKRKDVKAERLAKFALPKLAPPPPPPVPGEKPKA